MTKTFKRIAASVMAAATLTTSAIGSMSASAANTEDTPITDFTAPPSVAGTYTALPVSQKGVRVKDNSSSVYLYITSSTYNLSVQTWGLSDTNWSAAKKANCTLNSKGSSTSSVTVKAGYRYEIYNEIKKVDNGTYDYACAGLKFCAVSQYNSSTVNGQWSPDYSYDSRVIVAG